MPSSNRNKMAIKRRRIKDKRKRNKAKLTSHQKK